MVEDKALRLRALAEIHLNASQHGVGFRIDENHHIVDMKDGVAIARLAFQTHFVLVSRTAAARRRDPDATDIFIARLGDHPPDGG